MHNNPPSCDQSGHHGAKNFAAGDLICKKVSLNQKSWLPNTMQKPLLGGLRQVTGN